MRLYELEIGGLGLRGEQHSFPSPLRVGYRGPEPGSREAGSASFDVYLRTQADRDSLNPLLARDKIVIFREDGEPIYRGIITELDRETYVVHVTTAEMGAALGDKDVGMLEVGGEANPELGVYPIEFTQLLVPGFPMLQGRVVGVSRSGLPTRTPENILDSWQYYPYSAGTQYRSMMWREEDVGRIATRVRQLAEAQDLIVQTGDYDLSHDAGVVDSLVTNSSGELIRIPYAGDGSEGSHWDLWGLINVPINGLTMTYLWIMGQDPDHFRLHLYQLVNHGIAVPMGYIHMGHILFRYRPDDYVPLHTPFPDAPHLRTYGPFVEQGPYDAPNWIVFYLIGGKIEGTRHLRLARLYVVDLFQPANFDGQLLYSVRDNTGVFSDSSWNWYYGPFFTNQSQPLRHTRAARTGGQYEFNGAGLIRWRGDPCLSEMAIDFHERNLADVLREVSLATGAEWWIDSEGLLRVERLDRTIRQLSVQGKRTMADETTEGRAEDAYDSLSVSGIPLTNLGQMHLTRELQRLARENQNRRRRIKTWPMEPVRTNLGESVTYNGEAVGRLVGLERERELVTMEMESGE